MKHEKDSNSKNENEKDPNRYINTAKTCVNFFFSRNNYRDEHSKSKSESFHSRIRENFKKYIQFREADPMDFIHQIKKLASYYTDKNGASASSNLEEMLLNIIHPKTPKTFYESKISAVSYIMNDYIDKVGTLKPVKSIYRDRILNSTVNKLYSLIRDLDDMDKIQLLHYLKNNYDIATVASKKITILSTTGEQKPVSLFSKLINKLLIDHAGIKIIPVDDLDSEKLYAKKRKRADKDGNK